MAKRALPGPWRIGESEDPRLGVRAAGEDVEGKKGGDSRDEMDRRRDGEHRRSAGTSETEGLSSAAYLISGGGR